MASIRVICPWCKAPVRADSSQAGATIPCPKCQSDVILPESVAPVRPQAIAPSTVAPAFPGPAPVQGSPLPGVPIQGMPVQGMPVQGMPVQGMPVQGFPAQGMPLQGTPLPPGSPTLGVPVGGAFSFPQQAASSGLPDFGAAASTPYGGAPAGGFPQGLGMGAPGGMGLDPLGSGLPPLGMQPMGLPAMGLPSLPSGGLAAGGKPGGAAPPAGADGLFGMIRYGVGVGVLAALVLSLAIVIPFLASRKGPEPEPVAEAPVAVSNVPAAPSEAPRRSSRPGPPTRSSAPSNLGEGWTDAGSSRGVDAQERRTARWDAESGSQNPAVPVIAIAFLVIIGGAALCSLCGHLMLLAEAFDEGFMWGLGCLVVPGFVLLFCLYFWHRAKGPVVFVLKSWAVMFVAWVLLMVAAGMMQTH